MSAVPSTLAACLQPEALAALEAALAPPPALRARGRFEIELESAAEGTFAMTIDAGVVTAKKGFAKDPLIAVAISKTGFPLVQRLLQDAVDGFPRAPALGKPLAVAKAPRPGDLDAALLALSKLKDACLRFEVKGAGSYAIARGSVDEATQVLTLALDVAALDAALAGAPLSTVRLDMKGDRGVLAYVIAALGPLVERLR